MDHLHPPWDGQTLHNNHLVTEEAEASKTRYSGGTLAISNSRDKGFQSHICNLLLSTEPLHPTIVWGQNDSEEDLFRAAQADTNTA